MNEKNDNKKKPQQGKAALVFDVLFIMGLCFAVLLVTMLVQLKEAHVQGIGYTITLGSVCAVVIFLSVYLFFILKKSNKELVAIQEIAYDKNRRK